jgi:hypothetical protein
MCRTISTSWLGPPAAEEDIKAAVLIPGAVDRINELHSMGDLVNYAPRITILVLMINGRMDHISRSPRRKNRCSIRSAPRRRPKLRLSFLSGSGSVESLPALV